MSCFVEALRSDVADVQGGTTAEGIHLAAMAGTVDVLQRCFAGVETRGDVLLAQSVLAARASARSSSPSSTATTLITLSIADHVVRISSGPGNFPLSASATGASSATLLLGRAWRSRCDHHPGDRREYL